ncbi:MAG: AAA family ATPase [Pseudonocardia sp.]|nr:AAA family ATPase [Pseudonocardia sp.]
MTVNDVLRVLRERRLLIVGCLLLGLLGGAAATFLLPRDYSSQVTMYVSGSTTTTATPSAPATPTGESAYEANQLAKDRMPSFVQLVSSDRVTGAVITSLGLPDTPAQLADRMAVTALPDTMVITAAVTDRSPDRAAAIANAVASEFTGLVEQLQQAGSGQVTVQIVQPAMAPTSSVSPSRALMIGLGGVVGLLLGLVAAFFRNAVDTSVRAPGHLRSLTGAPTLGSVPAVRAVRRSPLVTAYTGGAPLPEAFRKIWTALNFRGGHARGGTARAGTVVTMTSATAGEGTTVTACNIAIAAAGAGRTALVIDANLRTPKVSTLFGLAESPGLTDVLAGRSALAEALQSYRHEDVIVDVLAAGRVRDEDTGRVTALLDLTEVVDEVRQDYDLVVVDTPPMGPVADAAAVAPLTDGAVLVVRHGRPRAAGQVDAVVETLRAVGAPLIGTVLTMVPSGTRTARRARTTAATPPADANTPEPTNTEPTNTEPTTAERGTPEPSIPEPSIPEPPDRNGRAPQDPGGTEVPAPREAEALDPVPSGNGRVPRTKPTAETEP